LTMPSSSAAAVIKIPNRSRFYHSSIKTLPNMSGKKNEANQNSQRTPNGAFKSRHQTLSEMRIEAHTPSSE